MLKRAIRTLWLIPDGMDLMWIPVHQLVALNERHYGTIQGLNKSETAAKYGDEQVHIWRRSYDIRPPALAADDPRSPPLSIPGIMMVVPEGRAASDRMPEGYGRALPALLAPSAIVPELKAGRK